MSHHFKLDYQDYSEFQDRRTTSPSIRRALRHATQPNVLSGLAAASQTLSVGPSSTPSLYRSALLRSHTTGWPRHPCGALLLSPRPLSPATSVSPFHPQQRSLDSTTEIDALVEEYGNRVTGKEGRINLNSCYFRRPSRIESSEVLM